jgi:hypothetical protein
METNRRKFFGFMGGAAAAAPVAMKQLANVPLSGGFAASRLGGGLAGPMPESMPGDYLRNELADYAKRLVALDASPADHERLFNPAVAERIDGLRSVSAVNKARMMFEERARFEKASQKSWIEMRMEQIKKQLGPLGGLS